MKELFSRLNRRFLFAHFEGAENDPLRDAANHYLVMNGSASWRFPDRATAEVAVRAAVECLDFIEAVSVLDSAEADACAGWYVNSYGGGETYVGKADEWPAAFAACGLDAEACIGAYLVRMIPRDWRFPRLSTSGASGAGG